jgi:hypothetical protein
MDNVDDRAFFLFSQWLVRWRPFSLNDSIRMPRPSML